MEDCDAHLLNLNVTSDTDSADSGIIAELRISHRNPESVARSLERYGYEVVGTDEPLEADDTLMRQRYDEFMHYLNV